MAIQLQPGRFYKARDGEIWCCFKVNLREPVHAQARCVQVSSDRVEYFFLDGRYDNAGAREHTLISEVVPA